MKKSYWILRSGFKMVDKITGTRYNFEKYKGDEKEEYTVHDQKRGNGWCEFL